MPPERTTQIEAEGNDFPSMLQGFSCIGMPPERRSAARALVEEVAKSNAVRDFHWYKPAGSNELSCYWDGSDVNLLWIGPGHVHVRADGPVVRPDRPVDWRRPTASGSAGRSPASFPASPVRVSAVGR